MQETETRKRRCKNKKNGISVQDEMIYIVQRRHYYTIDSIFSIWTFSFLSWIILLNIYTKKSHYAQKALPSKKSLSSRGSNEDNYHRLIFSCFPSMHLSPISAKLFCLILERKQKGPPIPSAMIKLLLWSKNPHSFRDLQTAEWASRNSWRASLTKYMATRN